MNKERAREILKSYLEEYKTTLQEYEDKNIPHDKGYIHHKETVQALDIAIDSLDNEWVDVRDRLPSESENVLITCFYCYSGEYDVTLGHCENGEWYYTDERVLISNADSTEENSAQIVIAWRPLPQPYERKE